MSFMPLSGWSRWRRPAQGRTQQLSKKRMPRCSGWASGYKAERLAVVRDGFEVWFSEGQWAESGDDSQIARGQLLSDIEHLRKALARGSGGQD